MTFPFWCVLAAALLPYLVKVVVGKAMSQQGGYDNRHPRDQQAKLTGWGRRAVAAQLNSFEAFPIFAACVFIAHFRTADLEKTSWLAGAFIALRIIYVGLYLGNQSTLRSIVWFGGLFCCFAIAIC